MDDKTLARRILCVGIVIAGSLPLLSSCGVTDYHKMLDAHAALHTPEMERAIQEARK